MRVLFTSALLLLASLKCESTSVSHLGESDLIKMDDQYILQLPAPKHNEDEDYYNNRNYFPRFVSEGVVEYQRHNLSSQTLEEHEYQHSLTFDNQHQHHLNRSMTGYKRVQLWEICFSVSDIPLFGPITVGTSIGASIQVEDHEEELLQKVTMKGFVSLGVKTSFFHLVSASLAVVGRVELEATLPKEGFGDPREIATNLIKRIAMDNLERIGAIKYDKKMKPRNHDGLLNDLMRVQRLKPDKDGKINEAIPEGEIRSYKNEDNGKYSTKHTSNAMAWLAMMFAGELVTDHEQIQTAIGKELQNAADKAEPYKVYRGEIYTRWKKVYLDNRKSWVGCANLNHKTFLKIFEHASVPITPILSDALVVARMKLCYAMSRGALLPDDVVLESTKIGTDNNKIKNTKNMMERLIPFIFPAVELGVKEKNDWTKDLVKSGKLEETFQKWFIRADFGYDPTLADARNGHGDNEKKAAPMTPDRKDYLMLESAYHLMSPMLSTWCDNVGANAPFKVGDEVEVIPNKKTWKIGTIHKIDAEGNIKVKIGKKVLSKNFKENAQNKQIRHRNSCPFMSDASQIVEAQGDPCRKEDNECFCGLQKVTVKGEVTFALGSGSTDASNLCKKDGQDAMAVKGTMSTAYSAEKENCKGRCYLGPFKTEGKTTFTAKFDTKQIGLEYATAGQCHREFTMKVRLAAKSSLDQERLQLIAEEASSVMEAMAELFVGLANKVIGESDSVEKSATENSLLSIVGTLGKSMVNFLWTLIKPRLKTAFITAVMSAEDGPLKKIQDIVTHILDYANKLGITGDSDDSQSSSESGGRGAAVLGAVESMVKTQASHILAITIKRSCFQPLAGSQSQESGSQSQVSQSQSHVSQSQSQVSQSQSHVSQSHVSGSHSQVSSQSNPPRHHKQSSQHHSQSSQTRFRAEHTHHNNDNNHNHHGKKGKKKNTKHSGSGSGSHHYGGGHHHNSKHEYVNKNKHYGHGGRSSSEQHHSRRSKSAHNSSVWVDSSSGSHIQSHTRNPGETHKRTGITISYIFELQKSLSVGAGVSVGAYASTDIKHVLYDNSDLPQRMSKITDDAASTMARDFMNHLGITHSPTKSPTASGPTNYPTPKPVEPTPEPTKFPTKHPTHNPTTNSPTTTSPTTKAPTYAESWTVPTDKGNKKIKIRGITYEVTFFRKNDHEGYVDYNINDDNTHRIRLGNKLHTRATLTFPEIAGSTMERYGLQVPRVTFYEDAEVVGGNKGVPALYMERIEGANMEEIIQVLARYKNTKFSANKEDKNWDPKCLFGDGYVEGAKEFEGREIELNSNRTEQIRAMADITQVGSDGQAVKQGKGIRRDRLKEMVTKALKCTFGKLAKSLAVPEGVKAFANVEARHLFYATNGRIYLTDPKMIVDIHERVEGRNPGPDDANQNYYKKLKYGREQKKQDKEMKTKYDEKHTDNRQSDKGWGTLYKDVWEKSGGTCQGGHWGKVTLLTRDETANWMQQCE